MSYDHEMDGADLSRIAQAGSELAPAVRGAAEASGALAIARELLGSFVDQLLLRREKRWAQMSTAAIREFEAAKVAPNVIRDKTLRAIYEYGTLEDEPGMVRLWTNLLSAALGGEDIPPAYPAILRELEPIEAQFLYAAIVSAENHWSGRGSVDTYWL